MDTTLTPDELADFLGCTIEDLKNWRRLAPDHPNHLPSTLVDGRRRYDPTTVVAWLVRNPKRLAQAKFLFDERIALHNTTLAALRDAPTLEPQPLEPLWNDLLEQQHSDHQHQLQENPQ